MNKREPEKIIEIVYRWPDGRHEVRYRRTEGSPEAIQLMAEVDSLDLEHGTANPYYYRHRILEGGHYIPTSRLHTSDNCPNLTSDNADYPKQGKVLQSDLDNEKD